MKRKRVLSMVCLLAAGLLLGGCPWLPFNWPPLPRPPADLVFTSADPGNGGRYNEMPMAPSLAGTDDVLEDTGEGNQAVEREVVEPDLIRRDGNLLYVLNQFRGLTIVDLDSHKLLSQTPTFGWPRDLYLVGDRAYVLVSYASDYVEEGGMVTAETGSRLYVIDVSDPSATTEAGRFDLDGELVDSRLVGSVLYTVSAHYQWYYDDMPGGAVAVDQAAKWTKAQTSSSWVTSVNVADPEDIQQVATLDFDGYGDVIQATSSAIFVSASDWETDQTVITYIDISDPLGTIAERGAITLQGRLRDRFKMNAYNGVLRVVTNTGWWGSRNVFVTTVDLTNPDALTVLDTLLLEDAADEQLFATRFDGDVGYVVTYFIVDPLFVIDMSDPANLVLAAALEVPGWSTHIEPRGDHLVALGVDDTDGSRHVSVSVYDVTDLTNPLLADRENMGENWAWSPAYGDVKAFTVLDDMIIVPFSGWDDDGRFDRLQFIGYNNTAPFGENSLELLGYVDLDGEIARSFEYDTRYYGVTSEELAAIDASDPANPKVVQRLTLAEYLADYHELSAAVGVEIISRYDRPATTIRTVTPEGDVIGELQIEMSNVSKTHLYGQSVILVATGWDEQGGYYLVHRVDCSEPGNPTRDMALRLDVDPYWGGYWYYYDRPMPMGINEAVMDSRKLIADCCWRPWWQPAETTLLAGDVLALRCYADKPNLTLGTERAYEGLALVDLSTGSAGPVLGLGFEGLDSVHAVGDKLYISNRDSVGYDTDDRPVAAYYLRQLDPATYVLGPSVNVPGGFLQYDPATDLLLLQDLQYSAGWNVERELASLRWDGAETLQPLDTMDMPEGASTVLARGARIFYDAYDNGGQTLGAIAVDGDGAFADAGSLNVSDQWVSLIDAHGPDAFVVIGGGAIAQYDFTGEPVLQALVRVMNSPTQMRFGTETAYAPLGYAGLAVMPL